ncbi:MAG: hypothetical protein HKP40_10370 [Litoreibacter sp.]|nr:hypothetical protein [Litoreibacter sp.]
MSILYIAQFLRAEDGASVVDFTVLTAAVMALALGASVLVVDGTEDLTQEIETQITEQEIAADW